ncbi:SPRY domain-containing protein [Pseudorhodobacter aquimaris]|uniref:hypothetical protein n=1 Tax=Pseudorhodobacter aquimaris TaxID=687412 RepID=UPI00067BD1A0|nr:hypothetical protein [Pseudorhodobacter aquimaris]
MSRLMLRAAILEQSAAGAGPPLDIGSIWQLDVTRRPAGYTLSNDNQTAVNTSGGTNYQRWVPTAKAILPSDGRRYWEVLCAPGGAAAFDGYFGVVSAEQREEFNAGNNPITLGSIGWRGNGTLWSSDTTASSQRMTGLPSHGSGDVLMFILDPATASLWTGKNGIWHSDPVSGAATWTAGGSTAFYPQIQGRNSGDGGTLRSLPSQFSYPVPPVARALGFADPDLSIFEADVFFEFGWDKDLSVGEFDAWLVIGGGKALTATHTALYIEVELL